MRTDPVGIRSGINYFLYVLSNPLNKFDQTGLTWGSLPSFIGVESHCIFGVGLTRVQCCDEKGNRRTFLYKKSCVGLAVGVSGSGGIVTGMSGKNCDPDKYKGWFYEVGIALGDIGVGIDFGISDDGQLSGVNEGGAGPGLGFLVKATWCLYELIDQDIEPCGCK